MEDGIDDSVHALDVYKADHRSCSSPRFKKATLNDIGGPQLLPQVFREAHDLRISLYDRTHGGLRTFGVADPVTTTFTSLAE